MRQLEKLRNSLRDFYDHQPVAVPEGEWERASAYLAAERRRKRLRPLLITFAVVIPVLLFWLGYIFTLPEKQDLAAKNISLPSKTATFRPTSVTGLAPQFTEAFQSPSPGKNDQRRAFTKIASGTNVNGNAALHRSAKQLPENHGIAEAELQNLPVPLAASQNKNNAGQYEATVDPPMKPSVEVPAVDPLDAANQTVNIAAPISGTTTGRAEPAQETQPQRIDISENVKSIETLPAGINSATNLATAEFTVEKTARDSATKPGPLGNEALVFEGGGTWHYGWLGANRRDARGFSPIAIIGYQQRVAERCYFSFGLGYTAVNKLSNSSKTSRVSSYLYGEESRVTVITPSSLHYLIAPLRVLYKADRNSTFGAGMNLSYLMNVDAEVTSYDEVPGSTSNYETTVQSGYTEGFSWFDCQAALIYRRRIVAPLSMQAEIFFGLKDVKQNRFFGFNHFEGNSGIRLSIIYHAFRKNYRR